MKLENPFASRSQRRSVSCNEKSEQTVASSRQRRLDVAAGLFILAGLYMVVAPFTLLIPSHASDNSWPNHARFHVTWATGKLLGVGMSDLLVAAFALRKGEKWSWVALASNSICVGGFQIAASRIHHGAIPSIWRHDRSTLIGLLSLLGTVVGLVLAWQPLFGMGGAVAKTGVGAAVSVPLDYSNGELGTRKGCPDETATTPVDFGLGGRR